MAMFALVVQNTSGVALYCLIGGVELELLEASVQPTRLKTTTTSQRIS